MSTQILSLKAAAEFLNLKRQTLQRYERKNIVRSLRVNGSKYFSKNDLLKLLQWRAEYQEGQNNLNGASGSFGISALAKKLGVSRPTVYRYIDQGYKGIKLKATQAGVGTLVSVQDLAAFQNEIYEEHKRELGPN